MLSKEDIQTIEKETKQFFEKLGMDGEVKVEGGDESTVSVEVTVAEPSMFIGEGGQTLFEIQHILKSIVRRKISEPLYLFLDINDYRKNKEDYLRELARTTADEVALLKKEKELPAMPAAERRIIHMELAERGDVISESVGEGLERRVVVKVKSS